MQEINTLQQSSENTEETQKMIKNKLSDVKKVISSMEKESQRSLLDFYAD